MTDYMFSPSRVAFYPVSVRDAYEASGSWPDDGTLISEEVHTKIMDEQSSGRLICADTNGKPMTKEPPPPTAETLAAIERAWRDRQLGDTDPLVARHRDEIEEGATTLTSEQYQTLQAYRRALRAWPDNPAFPDPSSRPEPPAWLAAEDTH